MVMLASTSLLVIFCGIVCRTDTDLVWRLYEWDCRLMGITPPRWNNWQARVRLAGYGLMGLGVFGLAVSTGILS